MSSIVIVCPDTNIQLSVNRLETVATGGGKVALLSLARAWTDLGHDVTISGVNVVPGASGGLTFCRLISPSKKYDVAIFITGTLGHFQVPGIEQIQADKNILWMNSPALVEPPHGKVIDLFIVPSDFVFRRAVLEWGCPRNKVVKIKGGGVRERTKDQASARDNYAFVYFSHPKKGLENTINVLDGLVGIYPELHLDVYGSSRLWWDDSDNAVPLVTRSWIQYLGDQPHSKMASVLNDHGVLLYLTVIEDSFCPSITEALNAGVIVIASAHGANSEYIQHGVNGFLVANDDQGRPDLKAASDILLDYLNDPNAFEHIRFAAKNSVSTWDEQAQVWQRVWTGNY